MAQGLNYERRKRLVTTFSKPAPKGISYNRFAPQKVQTKDDVTPAIARFIGTMLKDTAISTGQVANEYVNLTLPGAILGQDFLSNQVSRVSTGAGESMRGEVTPMDIANVASLAPIPAGPIIRGGLLGTRALSKALPTVLKGGKYAPEVNVPIKPSLLARGLESSAASPIVEGVAEGALSAPFVPEILADDDADAKTKALMLAGIGLGVLTPGISRGMGKVKKIDKAVEGANLRLTEGTGSGVDAAIARTSKVGSADSDLTLAFDTSMDDAALAAFTIGQSGDAFKQSVRLYESDPEFKNIIDGVSSGNLSEADGVAAYSSWKSRIPKGARPPYIPTSSFKQLAKYAKTGELSSSRTKNDFQDVFKTDRFRLALGLKPVRGGVGDTRDLRLYDELVKAGEIEGVDIGKGVTLFEDHVDRVRAAQKARGEKPKYKLASTINSKAARLAMRQMEDWMNETYDITTDARRAAMRERLYQGVGYSGVGLIP